MTKSYHVRVHYRTGKKVQRKVSWFPNIEAASETDAGNKAIQRVVSRKHNSGVVEVETVEVREQRPINRIDAAVQAERDRIVAFAADWMGDIEFAQFKHGIEAGEHLK